MEHISGAKSALFWIMTKIWIYFDAKISHNSNKLRQILYCSPRVKISQKLQGPFGPLVLKNWGPFFFFFFFFSGSDLVFLILFTHQVLNGPTFSWAIWAIGRNILWALTKLWGQLALTFCGPSPNLRQLAWGPALFWSLLLSFKVMETISGSVFQFKKFNPAKIFPSKNINTQQFWIIHSKTPIPSVTY